MNGQIVNLKNSDEIYCPECAKPIKRNAVICPNCKIQLKALVAEKLTQEWHVFDPRKTRMREIKSPKYIYDAGLMISAIFYKDKYTIEAEGINWSKVLAKDIPGRLY